MLSFLCLNGPLVTWISSSRFHCVILRPWVSFLAMWIPYSLLWKSFSIIINCMQIFGCNVSLAYIQCRTQKIKMFSTICAESWKRNSNFCIVCQTMKDSFHEYAYNQKISMICSTVLLCVLAGYGVQAAGYTENRSQATLIVSQTIQSNVDN